MLATLKLFRRKVEEGGVLGGGTESQLTQISPGESSSSPIGSRILFCKEL
jgi:hypothetical protein